MGLFQNLLETYEVCKDAAGIVTYDENGIANEKKTFLPIFHTTFKSQICITLDCNGKFIKAERDSKDTTIIVPCTEGSAGRANYIAAHPLCDQLDYVSGISDDKISAYLKELGAWMEQTSGRTQDKLRIIYSYISMKTMLPDIEAVQIFKDSEYDNPGDTRVLNYEKIRKIGIRFVVEMAGDSTPEVWKDAELRQSWIDFIKPKGISQEDGLFDYLCGAQVGQIASQHPKNINSMTGNAKLISCNDISGYTFRGRFSSQNDAVIVDYEQSQKMHQTLRWLINNYGYNTDTQTIVVWAVDMDTKPLAAPYDNSYIMLFSLPSAKTETDKLSGAAEAVYADYSKKLRDIFLGYGKADKIKQHARRICIAVFDAATTGRMGLTFYQEMPQDKYLENIVNWHEETSYFLTAWIKGKDEKGKDKLTPYHYIGAPSYDDIIFAVYGKAHGGNDAGFNTLKRKIRKQLLECMFGNSSFPKNMVDMAAIRASHPLSFVDSNGKFSPGDWNRSINITCALARKYYKKTKKEGIALDLDETRRERDYLYGRLLAVADRLEQTALYKADKSNTRATNAVRLMAAFAVKPYHTWGILYKQLIPYINQLNGAWYYQSIIDDITVQLEEDMLNQNNKPLLPLYLLGYSAQRRAFGNRNIQENIGDDEHDITE